MARRFLGFGVKRVLATSLILLVSCFVVTSAQAASLTFDQTGQLQAGGFLYYAGGNTPLFGSQMQFHEILATGTPLNAGANLPCDVCFLNFQTGNIVSNNNPVFTFAGGGSIDMQGSIDFPDPDPDFSGEILTGSFNNSPLQPFVVTLSGGTLLAFGEDQKADAVNNFFGLGENWAFTDTTIVFNRLRQCGDGESVGDENANGIQCFNFNEELMLSQLEDDGRYAGANDVAITIGNGGFILAVDTADFQNRPAPAPGTAALLLLGVTALVASRRRKS